MDTTADRPEVLFFTSRHCSACNAMRPIADSIASRFDGTVLLTEVDSATDPVAPSTHRVRGVPTFVAIHNGIEVARAVGSRTPDQLAELFAAAEGGHRLRVRISPTDRTMRLMVGAMFAVAALVTSTQALWALAAAAGVFGTWDLIKR